MLFHRRLGERLLRRAASQHVSQCRRSGLGRFWSRTMVTTGHEVFDSQEALHVVDQKDLEFYGRLAPFKLSLAGEFIASRAN
jgi:hypothetical protein